MVKITVFRITGQQLFFTVPERVCEECDLTIQVARSVAERHPGRVTVEIKPWFNHLLSALRRGGWHPPVVLVDRQRVSQGVVPSPDALDAAVREAFRQQDQKESSDASDPTKA
jgi:hypothetical protein